MRLSSAVWPKFSKTLCSLEGCALALSAGHAPHCRRDNRCSRARHARLCALARRLCDIPNSRRFLYSLRPAFGRSNCAREASHERLSILQQERTLGGRSRKWLLLAQTNFFRARAGAQVLGLRESRFENRD